MPRESKPWFWEQKQCWYINIKGKRIRLSKDREEAFTKFHALKVRQDQLKDDDLLVKVCRDMVLWTEKNRSAGTLRFYKEHFENFLSFLNDTNRAFIKTQQLTPDIFEEFLESIPEGRRTGAVQMIKRVYNWALKRGRISNNPIMALEKPSAGRRRNLVPDEDFKKMIELSEPNFAELMQFCWEVGCRPQEAWKLKKEHIQEQYQRCVIPKKDTKRKKADRAIYCTDTAWEIVLQRKDNEPYLFTTSTGTQWNRDNISCRMGRLKEKVGKRYAFYDFRHTRITKMMKAGMATHLIAKLVGTSIAMLEKHYDQSDQDAEYMLTSMKAFS